MSTVEALHELRRLAQPTCWRCQGTGWVRHTGQTVPGQTACAHGFMHVNDGCAVHVLLACPSCDGTGQPERAPA